MKVDVADLKEVSRVINKIINEIPDKSLIERELNYINYFEKKYLEVENIRKQEQEYYDYSNNFINNIPDSKEKENLKCELLSKYYAAKNKREKLQKEVETIAKKEYLHLYI